MNDIETARGLMTCIGFADSPSFAMSIPFIRTGHGPPFNSYWSFNEEKPTSSASSVRCLIILTSRIEGQNYLYDIQYIQKYLGCSPRTSF